jgi:hypothetical protein
MSPLPRPVQVSLRRHRPRRRSGAFTLIELVIGASLSVVVVGSLAALALLAELRLGENAEVSQNLRDSWGRTLNFISDEAHNASWIRTDLPSSITYPSTCNGGVAPTNLLVLEGPPDTRDDPTKPLWTVIYGVRSNPGTGGWRGHNVLVRCGPPLRDTPPATTTAADLQAAAEEGNLVISRGGSDGKLSFTNYQEMVITDQLAQDNPFQVVLYDITSGRDRNARLSLFLSRRQGQTYPPPDTFQGYHTQIRANRNPGIDILGDPNCVTTLNSDTNNAEPPKGCQPITTVDGLLRRNSIKEYNLPATGTFTVNRCGKKGDGCEGPASIENIDVVFLKGRYDDFKKNKLQFDQNNNKPCSRTRCYLTNGSQTVTIYDGDVLVFYDRIVHL